MVSAFTTVAVKNHSMHPPEPLANPLDYMLNHKDRKTVEEIGPTDEQLEAKSEYQSRLMDMAARLKAQEAEVANGG
jgi:hypothetical protein